jgi:hypothetical protein
LSAARPHALGRTLITVLRTAKAIVGRTSFDHLVHRATITREDESLEHAPADTNCQQLTAAAAYVVGVALTAKQDGAVLAWKDREPRSVTEVDDLQDDALARTDTSPMLPILAEHDPPQAAKLYIARDVRLSAVFGTRTPARRD